MDSLPIKCISLPINLWNRILSTSLLKFCRMHFEILAFIKSHELHNHPFENFLGFWKCICLLLCHHNFCLFICFYVCLLSFAVKIWWTCCLINISISKVETKLAASTPFLIWIGQCIAMTQAKVTYIYLAFVGLSGGTPEGHLWEVTVDQEE